MLNLKLARKYAAAIFSIAEEDKKIDAIGAELREVNDSLLKIPGVSEFFQNPQIQRSDKKALLQKIFAGELSENVYNFLMLLVDKRRFSLLPAIAEDYTARANEAEGIVIADVWTASDFSAKLSERLKEKLAALSGKKIELRTHEDKSLIGGVVVKIGDKRIDGSVKGRLAALGRGLKV